ncbi:MAG: hypothetical protein H8D32_01015 [Dehalococcoidia bacterium]|nr:hypothetical protein [Dehalococcoidia bacterium]
MGFPFFKIPKTVTWKEVREEILEAIEEEQDGLALIKPFEYQDMLTNQRIAIKKSPYYSIISVDGREYYFLAETGEFDETAFEVKEY